MKHNNRTRKKYNKLHLAKNTLKKHFGGARCDSKCQENIQNTKVNTTIDKFNKDKKGNIISVERYYINSQKPNSASNTIMNISGSHRSQAQVKAKAPAKAKTPTLTLTQAQAQALAQALALAQATAPEQQQLLEGLGSPIKEQVLNTIKKSFQHHNIQQEGEVYVWGMDGSLKHIDAKNLHKVGQWGDNQGGGAAAEAKAAVEALSKYRKANDDAVEALSKYKKANDDYREAVRAKQRLTGSDANVLKKANDDAKAAKQANDDAKANWTKAKAARAAAIQAARAVARAAAKAAGAVEANKAAADAKKAEDEAAAKADAKAAGAVEAKAAKDVAAAKADAKGAADAKEADKAAAVAKAAALSKAKAANADMTTVVVNNKREALEKSRPRLRIARENTTKLKSIRKEAKENGQAFDYDQFNAALKEENLALEARNKANDDAIQAYKNYKEAKREAAEAKAALRRKMGVNKAVAAADAKGKKKSLFKRLYTAIRSIMAKWGAKTKKPVIAEDNNRLEEEDYLFVKNEGKLFLYPLIQPQNETEALGQILWASFQVKNDTIKPMEIMKYFKNGQRNSKLFLNEDKGDCNVTYIIWNKLTADIPGRDKFWEEFKTQKNGDHIIKFIDIINYIVANENDNTVKTFITGIGANYNKSCWDNLIQHKIRLDNAGNKTGGGKKKKTKRKRQRKSKRKTRKKTL